MVHTFQISSYSPSGLNYKPWVDGKLLTSAPIDIFTRGDFHRVPVMTGYVADEWSRNVGLFIHDAAQHNMSKIWQTAIISTLLSSPKPKRCVYCKDMLRKVSYGPYKVNSICQ